METADNLPFMRIVRIPNRPLDRSALLASFLTGVAALGLGLFFALALWMPAAFVDDICYVGPAIGFAQTGHLTSFLCEMNYRSDTQNRPFWYTPLYFYALGWWLIAMGGPSTSAILAFAAVSAAVAAAASAAFLSRLGSTPRWAAGGGIFVWTTFYSAAFLGLRPEPLGIAVLLVGLALIPSLRGTVRLTGFFCVALSTLIAPRLAPWAATFGTFVLIAAALRIGNSPRHLVSLLIHGAGGTACALLIFFVSIDFEWNAFSNDFFHHMNDSTGSLPLASFFHISASATTGFAPVNYLGVTGLFLAGCLASRSSGILKTATPLLLTFIAGIGASIMMGGVNTLVIFLYLTTAGLWAGSGFETSTRKKAAIAGVLLAGIPLTATAVAFARTGYLQPESWARYRIIREAALSKPWRDIWVDNYALRYVFDSNPPPSVRDSVFGKPVVSRTPVPGDPQTAYIVAREFFFNLEQPGCTSEPVQPYGGTLVSGWQLLTWTNPHFLFLTADPADAPCGSGSPVVK